MVENKERERENAEQNSIFFLQQISLYIIYNGRRWERAPIKQLQEHEYSENIQLENPIHFNMPTTILIVTGMYRTNNFGNSIL